MSIADKILIFYSELDLPDFLPEGVSAMNPYLDANTMECCTTFYTKFYNDDIKRKLLLGINPGRFGGGITGVAKIKNGLSILESCLDAKTWLVSMCVVTVQEKN